MYIGRDVGTSDLTLALAAWTAPFDAAIITGGTLRMTSTGTTTPTELVTISDGLGNAHYFEHTKVSSASADMSFSLAAAFEVSAGDTATMTAVLSSVSGDTPDIVDANFFATAWPR